MDMSQETQQENERYAMYSFPGMVQLADSQTDTIVAEFVGPERLLAATERLEELKATEASQKAKNERYVLEVLTSTVWIVDTETCVSTEMFAGEDRLLAATARLEELKAGVTPQEFVSKTLPAFAREQRKAALLAETRQIEAKAIEQLAFWNETLERATALRYKLEAPETALSATLPDETAPGVPASTPEASAELLTGTAGYAVRIASVGAAYRERHPEGALYRPGPY